ncbi:MAG: heme exporter protein CcmB [Caldilineaceae bacterium]|nr:heme exporter protein CcmB [Caldilineaceae bacterium]MCB0137092.1 heme exporter protein CcmB [Caldilineaceae bacterium]
MIGVERDETKLIARPVSMRLGGGMLAFLRKVWAVCAKDLRAELRGREVFSTMTSFSVLAVLTFGLAFDLRVPRSEMIAPGVLWVVILFGGVLGLNRSFGAEVDRGTLPALLLAPVDRSAIYFGKLLANLAFTMATTLVILGVMFFIFDVNMFHPVNVLGVALGILGYVGVGTIFAALTASSRARETMLPILLLPVMVPVFVAGVGLTAGVVDGKTFDDLRQWLGILAAFDLIFVIVAYLLFDLIWEDA